MYLNYVTAIDDKYLPGLYALHNSIKENANECTLSCMVYGDYSLARDVSELGINVIHNPPIGADIPKCGRWSEPVKATWSKFIVPKLFNEDILWVDADAIVLNKSEPIEFDEPVGATNTEQYTLDGAVGGLKEGHKKPVLQAGMLYFNVKRWNELEITERCYEAMRLPYDYKYVDQSVLSYVLMGNFHRLPDYWHILANRRHYRDDELRTFKIFHYNGRNPWQEKLRNQEIWNKYARKEDRK